MRTVCTGIITSLNRPCYSFCLREETLNPEIKKIGYRDSNIWSYKAVI